MRYEEALDDAAADAAAEEEGSLLPLPALLAAPLLPSRECENSIGDGAADVRYEFIEGVGAAGIDASLPAVAAAAGSSLEEVPAAAAAAGFPSDDDGGGDAAESVGTGSSPAIAIQTSATKRRRTGAEERDGTLSAFVQKKKKGFSPGTRTSSGRGKGKGGGRKEETTHTGLYTAASHVP
jgi:hypothetical protein